MAHSLTGGKVAICVGDGVKVGLALGTDVGVGVNIGFGILVTGIVGIGLAVNIGVGLTTGVLLGIAVVVAVGVTCGTRVGVAVADAEQAPTKAQTCPEAELRRGLSPKVHHLERYVLPCSTTVWPAVYTCAVAHESVHAAAAGIDAAPKTKASKPSANLFDFIFL